MSLRQSRSLRDSHSAPPAANSWPRTIFFFARARARAHARAQAIDMLPPDKPVHAPCARGFPLSWGARTRAQALAREIFLLPPAVPHAAARARTRRGRQGPRRGLRG